MWGVYIKSNFYYVLFNLHRNINGYFTSHHYFTSHFSIKKLVTNIFLLQNRSQILNLIYWSFYLFSIAVMRLGWEIVLDFFKNKGRMEINKLIKKKKNIYFLILTNGLSFGLREVNICNKISHSD